MALTGIKFCKPTVEDTKKQNRPIFQPLRLLSSSASTMNQTKTHDFPFVALTGHKLVDDPCITPSFDIMDDDHTNFDGDFGFVKNNNFTNARAIFKNASFKGCHQFPMISISQLVGGFVGSKSQVRAKNREPHQIWDIVFQKLDEFVNSRPVEKYSEHCYEFQTLSQNFIGALYEESGSALGLAASYILADGGQSFKNANPTNNFAKSSPTIKQSVKIVPPPANTFVSDSSVLPSHSPSNPSTVPVILNFVDYLISQSDSAHRDPILPDPERFACVDRSVSTSPALGPPSVYNILAEQPLNKDPILEKPSLVPSEAKQSYAEVARMAHRRSPTDGDRRQTRTKSASKRYRRADNRYFVRRCNDTRQRCVVDSSNWRDPGAGPTERKDLRRDHFAPAHFKSEYVPGRTSQCRRRGNGTGRENPALGTVPEFPPAPKTGSSRLQSPPTPRGEPCQFYNPGRRSCANWRCRQGQHHDKAGARRDVRHNLADDRDGYDRAQNSDATPDSNESGDVRVNTLEAYITTTPLCDGSRSGSVRTVPDVARRRSLSETSGGCPLEAPPPGKERSSSESGDGVGGDSRPDSSSSSSLNSSSGSCRPEADSRRRFSSECDSEDSFVIFEGAAADPDSDSDSDDGSSSDWSTDDNSCGADGEDEVDGTCRRLSPAFRPLAVPCEDLDASARLRELNERWEAKQRGPAARESDAARTPCKKAVRFAPGPLLATVHPMVSWGHAYRAARCGPWEVMARDRERFRQRVERCEPTLTAVLGAEHRQEVLRRRVEGGRHDRPTPPPTDRKRTTLAQVCDAF